MRSNRLTAVLIDVIIQHIEEKIMRKIALTLAAATATLALSGCVGVPYGTNYYRPAPVYYYTPPVYKVPYYGPYCCYR
jgi:hypothetical protein